MRDQDFKTLELITEELTLADKKNPDGKSLAKVKVYRDTKTQKAYQVDLFNREYREAPHVLSQYGPWKKLVR